MKCNAPFEASGFRKLRVEGSLAKLKPESQIIRGHSRTVFHCPETTIAIKQPQVDS